jgi:hypothetical protein
MKIQPAGKKEKMVIAVGNRYKDDISDCLGILRYLQAFDGQHLPKEYKKEAMHKLEGRTGFLVQETDQ